MSPRLIDVHTHTTFHVFENDTEAVIKRALDADIWLINVGTQKDTSLAAVQAAEKYSVPIPRDPLQATRLPVRQASYDLPAAQGVYAAIGLHPIHTDKSFHDIKELGGDASAKEFTSRGEVFDYDYYKKLGKSDKVVAIGECGLDYYRVQPQTNADGTRTDAEEIKRRQKEAFESQISLSHDLQKPIMIHCRNAFADLISLVQANSYKLQAVPGIIHFFTGTVPDAKALMELGFSFSFGGVTTFTRDYDEVLKYVGLDRIVLETDAPYVTPAPHRGKRNEPSYLPFVAEGIGKILGVSTDEVGSRTTTNARKIFRI